MDVYHHEVAVTNWIKPRVISNSKDDREMIHIQETMILMHPSK